MADRYWVGGTAAWDGTAGTKWALTSGGAGGQAVPTSADDVFFSNLSTGTCTISAGNTGAKSINCTGFTGTLAGSSAITVSGSVTLVAGMTFTYTGLITLIATGTLTSAGKTFGNITVNGSGSTVTLGDALTLTAGVTLTAGTLTTANFNVTAFAFSSSNANTRTINMGSSTFTLSSTSIPWNIQTTTGLTLNAGTSTINLTGNNNRTFYGGGFTYYNLNDGGGTSLGIVGNNTFNDFTATGLIGVNILECFGTNTFTNFNYSPAAPASAELRGGTFSKSSGTVSVSRLLILNSTAAGGATWNASDSRDLGGNTGWNITAPATARYWVGGTAAWDGTAGAKWATTSGGAGGASAPGAVEQVFFTNLSTGTCTISSGNSGAFSLDCTGFTGTLAGTTAISLYGSVTLVAGMTYTYTGTITFISSSTLTTGGKTLGSVTASQGTLTLGSACTLGTTSTFVLGQATLALSNFTLSTGIFSSQSNLTRQIQFGTGNIALTSTTAGTTVLSMATATNFTWTGTGGFTRNMAATATVVFGTSATGNASNAPDLTINAGASALTITGGSWFKNLVFTGSTSSVTSSGGLNIAGNLTVASGGSYSLGAVTYRASGTITSLGKIFGAAQEITGAGTVVTLADALTTNTTFTLTEGTLDLAGFTLSAGAFSSNNSNTRAIAFGSGNIALTSTTAAATVLSMATATGFTWTGTGGFTRNQAATATVVFGTGSTGTASNAPNLTVNAGSSALTITSNSWFKNVVFTGSTCTVTAINPSIAGNLTLASGGTYTSVSPVFVASATVTSVGKTLGSTTISGSGITVTLADAMTVGTTNTFTLTQGTLALANFNLSAGAFSSSNSNTRAITFGSGNIALTSTGTATTILSMATATNFTYTGTGGFTRNQAASATVTFGTSGGTVSNAPNLSVNAGGTFNLTITGNSYLKNLNFTGSTATASGVYNACGDLTLASGAGAGAYITLGPTFRASATLTSAGKTLGSVTVNGSGIAVTLADAFVSNNALTLTEGTFANPSNFNVTAYNFVSNSGSACSLSLGSSTWAITGGDATTSWVATNASLTFNAGTSTINLTYVGVKEFFAGNRTYYNVNVGGTGDFYIYGTNTFNNITNSVQPATVIFESGLTQTVSNFGLSGTAGNLITISSEAPGFQFTLSKASGTVNAQYLSIQDSVATGGATWNALTSNGNVDAGNNTGWIFGSAATGNMFLMFS